MEVSRAQGARETFMVAVIFEIWPATVRKDDDLGIAAPCVMSSTASTASFRSNASRALPSRTSFYRYRFGGTRTP